MRRFASAALLAGALLSGTLGSATPAGGAVSGGADSAVRFATYNASLNRATEGELVTDLSDGTDPQARKVAEIVQRVRPDVLLVNEFDYDADGRAAGLFQRNYLSVEQGSPDRGRTHPIRYRYRYTAPSNTGIASGYDLNNDGKVVSEPGTPGYGDDALGFGAFPGQYGMAVYSKYPIDRSEVRTFQDFRWKDMPDNAIPPDWYTPAELDAVRLSSKSHWDLPIRIDGRTVHLLASHPTPPVFDGPEDRNGRRNHDEIRFSSDYVRGWPWASYIYDDTGHHGGLAPGAAFVIVGDQNADPYDGDSYDDAAGQLVENPLVHNGSTPSSAGAVEASRTQGGSNDQHAGDPAYDTADFTDAAPTGPGNLRADYVLPWRWSTIRDSAVFWPPSSDPLSALIDASDHRLVWIDLARP